MSEIPWFWPGVAASLAAALVLSGAVGRGFGRGSGFGFLLVLSLGAIASATLTPGREALELGTVGSGGCDLRRVIPPPLEELLTVSETMLNVALFIPLGLVLGLLPSGRAQIGLGIVALSLPFAIESTQMVVVAFDRACESADVVDNLTGLGVGLIAGLLLRAGLGATRPRT